MKRFFIRMFFAIIHSYERCGRVRAAAELSRMGYYAEAKKIMLQK